MENGDLFVEAIQIAESLPKSHYRRGSGNLRGYKDSNGDCWVIGDEDHDITRPDAYFLDPFWGRCPMKRVDNQIIKGE